MRKHAWGAFIVGVAAVVTSCGPTAMDPLAALSAQIVEGTTNTGDPAVVALMAENNVYCTGTLIQPSTVLTAAHCVQSYGTQPRYFVGIGTYENQLVRTRVIEHVKHPQYDENSLVYDFGLLRLQNPILSVAPLPINSNAMGSGDLGRQVRQVGFGANNGANGGSGGGTKRVGNHPIAAVESVKFASGTPNGGQVCFGDSGGPAFLVQNGETFERVVGVASYTQSPPGGTPCTTYGYQARVDAVHPWILSTYAPWEGPTCNRDNKCKSDCVPVDQDCACAADSTCNPECLDLSDDPDCPVDCGENGVCSLSACPREDTDCVAEKSACSSAEQCLSRRCVSDPQHSQAYCSRVCAQAQDCPEDMACSGDGACRYRQRTTAREGEVCTPETFCLASSCALIDGARICATSCSEFVSCPTGASCVRGGDGFKWCKKDPVVVPVTVTPVAETPAPPASVAPEPPKAGCSAATPNLALGPLLLLAAWAFGRRRNA